MGNIGDPDETEETEVVPTPVPEEAPVKEPLIEPEPVEVPA